jgi:glycosyltransferase involved in cell wall biosynthesis
VVLEAQASGLPVIVSEQGGPKELMTDGETGVVVRAGSREDLLDAILSFLAEPDRTRAMGRRARALTEERQVAADDIYSTILHSQKEAVNF